MSINHQSVQILESVVGPLSHFQIVEEAFSVTLTCSAYPAASTNILQYKLKLSSCHPGSADPPSSYDNSQIFPTNSPPSVIADPKILLVPVQAEHAAVGHFSVWFHMVELIPTHVPAIRWKIITEKCFLTNYSQNHQSDLFIKEKNA